MATMTMGQPILMSTIFPIIHEPSATMQQAATSSVTPMVPWKSGFM